jgi:hypothetical protein
MWQALLTRGRLSFRLGLTVCSGGSSSGTVNLRSASVMLAAALLAAGKARLSLADML